MAQRGEFRVEQPFVDSVSDHVYDVIVVGAGPAGSLTAVYLARWGYDVLVIDKQRFPRDKVCGDALIPDSLRCLKQAGLYDTVAQAGHHLRKVDVYSPSRSAVSFPGDFITLKRIILDELLAGEATGHGARFCCGAVENIVNHTEQDVAVYCNAPDARLRARIAVIATGADIELLNTLGMVKQKQASAVALRSYIRSDYPIDRLVLSFDRSIIPGYAWIFPVGPDEYNVGCGIVYRHKNRVAHSLRDIFDRFMQEFPLCRSLKQASSAMSPLRGARLRCGLRDTRPVKRNRILAIGESIGATFPFTGEGIGKAMETGVIAAQMIHRAFVQNDVDSLQAAFPEYLERKLRPRYMGYQIAEDWLGHPWLNDLVMRRASKSRFLHDAMTGIITETVNPGEIFSFKGLLRSMWK